MTSGRIVRVVSVACGGVDPQGRETQMTYDGGRLARVADETGQRFLTFSYDGQGWLTALEYPAGRRGGYGYDTSGDLAVVTDTRGFAWTYVYTGGHLLQDVRDPLGGVLERTAYDSHGRAVQQWDGLLDRPLEITYGVDGSGVENLFYVPA